MLYSSFYQRGTSSLLLQNQVFSESFKWITENAGTAANGIYELGEDNWFVNVHGYSTQSRDKCVWENHTQTIDIQYIIAGLEGIDFAEVQELGPPVHYNLRADTERFSPEAFPFSHLVLHSGEFVVFFPGEAHRPKIAVDQACRIRKLVVKIPVTLIDSAS